MIFVSWLRTFIRIISPPSTTSVSEQPREAFSHRKKKRKKFWRNSMRIDTLEALLYFVIIDLLVYIAEIRMHYVFQDRKNVNKIWDISLNIPKIQNLITCNNSGEKRGKRKYSNDVTFSCNRILSLTRFMTDLNSWRFIQHWSFPPFVQCEKRDFFFFHSLETEWHESSCFYEITKQKAL